MESDPDEDQARPDPSQGPGTEDPYRAVTLDDLVVTVYDHRRAAAGVLVAVLLVTVAVTGFQAATAPDPSPEPAPDPGGQGNDTVSPNPVDRYEASTTFFAFHEVPAILWILDSRGAAADAADRAGLVPAGASEAERGRIVDRVAANTTVERVSSDPPVIVTVSVTWTDPSEAADLANAYRASLDDRRPLLEDLTRVREWDRVFFEAASPNRTAEERAQAARENLTAYVEGLEYTRVLEPASPPSEPLPSADGSGDDSGGGTDAAGPASQEPTGPDWTLNLVLGSVVGLLLALATSFVLEAWKDIRAELEERRGR